MSCCGGKRAQAAMGSPLRPAAPRNSQSGPHRYSVAYFQYIGSSGLTVTGPMTGQRYRFDLPGAIVPVDLRDRASLAALTHLRQVMGP